jgi:hypothetical protein
VVNNRQNINQIQEDICSLLGLEKIPVNIWEYRRDRFINSINALIDKDIKNSAMLENRHKKTLMSGKTYTDSGEYIRMCYNEICVNLKGILEENFEKHKLIKYSIKVITDNSILFTLYCKNVKIAAAKIWIISTSEYKETIYIFFNVNANEKNYDYYNMQLVAENEGEYGLQLKIIEDLINNNLGFCDTSTIVDTICSVFRIAIILDTMT